MTAEAAAILGGAAISAIGGGLSSAKSASVAKRQMTRGIRDRVKDAKLAGIHPLYALGQPGGGGGFSGGSPAGQGLLALGEGLSQYGQYSGAMKQRKAEQQSIEQAGAKRLTLDTQIANSQVAANAASAKRDEAEAMLALSQAAAINRQRNGLGAGRGSGQADDPENGLGVQKTTKGIVDVEAALQPTTRPGDLGRRAGELPLAMDVRLPNSMGGGVVSVMSAEELSEAMEGWGFPLSVSMNIMEKYKSGNYPLVKSLIDARLHKSYKGGSNRSVKSIIKSGVRKSLKALEQDAFHFQIRKRNRGSRAATLQTMARIRKQKLLARRKAEHRRRVRQGSY